MPARKLELITVEDAATRLGLHHRTIRKYIAAGKLPAHRIAGWALRVDCRDVDALVRPVASAQGR